MTDKILKQLNLHDTSELESLNEKISILSSISSIALDDLINNFKMNSKYKFYYIGDDTNFLPSYYLKNDLEIREIFYVLIMKNIFSDIKELESLAPSKFGNLPCLSQEIEVSNTGVDRGTEALLNFLMVIKYSTTIVAQELYFKEVIIDGEYIDLACNYLDSDKGMLKAGTYFLANAKN